MFCRRFLCSIVTVSVVSKRHNKTKRKKFITNNNAKQHSKAHVVVVPFDSHWFYTFAMCVTLAFFFSHFNWVGCSVFTHFIFVCIVYMLWQFIWRSLCNSPELVYAQIALVTGSYSRCMVVHTQRRNIVFSVSYFPLKLFVDWIYFVLKINIIEAKLPFCQNFEIGCGAFSLLN